MKKWAQIKCQGFPKEVLCYASSYSGPPGINVAPFSQAKLLSPQYQEPIQEPKTKNPSKHNCSSCWVVFIGYVKKRSSLVQESLGTPRHGVISFSLMLCCGSLPSDDFILKGTRGYDTESRLLWWKYAGKRDWSIFLSSEKRNNIRKWIRQMSFWFTGT